MMIDEVVFSRKDGEMRDEMNPCDVWKQTRLMLNMVDILDDGREVRKNIDLV